jgi:pimeloyl-ACP methyl ester carboxylesterase
MKVNVERRGAGTPLVLLHGIGHRWQAWEPVLDLLAAHHDVIAVDLPGFGLSPVMDGHAHDLPGSLDVLAEIFAELGVERPHVAGNSLGGLIAIGAAARGLVGSATALSPAGFWTGAQRLRAFAILRALRAGALAPAVVSGIINGNARLRSASLGVLYAHPERIAAEAAAGDLLALRSAAAFESTLRTGKGFRWTAPQPKVPLTIAWGDRDRILPPRQVATARTVFPGARFVRLPDAGHVPMIDAPELVSTTILQTCARAEAAERAA